MRRLPNWSSIDVVIATALPYRSTIEMCDVDGSSSDASAALRGSSCIEGIARQRAAEGLRPRGSATNAPAGTRRRADRAAACRTRDPRVHGAVREREAPASLTK
jgi:hypothetical protein